jgi:hypothetical protein
MRGEQQNMRSDCGQLELLSSTFMIAASARTWQPGLAGCWEVPAGSGPVSNGQANAEIIAMACLWSGMRCLGPRTSRTCCHSTLLQAAHHSACLCMEQREAAEAPANVLL